MEDCCAVCADPLVWVAYGACGHRDVCSTCVVRLRFVLCNRRCCICKTECPTFFVTRALGSFTEAKVNFLEFPPDVTEGQHGNYWYHEDSQTFFDDVDHYRMISAMCRLSCNICDNNVRELRRGSSNSEHSFKRIEQLKGHLYHQHRMFMCNLCLEGRKIFISEQKLYTRSQLRQHVSTGDSEVDCSESERGGFAGHPICEFCKKPFYGDSELYLHMSTEHFTCHICQRQHPSQSMYYRNYEELEIHFREEHFLCEIEACLAKKFVVFQTDTEMKRHNAVEHGGHMSRAKRNAAFQIPISFMYRRNEQDQHRGRRHGLHPEQSSNNQLTMAIQASLETAFAESRFFESSHGRRPNAEHGEAIQDDEITSSMESLAISSLSESLSSSSIAAERHCAVNEPVLQEKSFPPLSNFATQSSSNFSQAFNQRSGLRLREESFPPLPGVKGKSRQNSTKHLSEGFVANTIPARINHRNKGLKSCSSASSSSHTRFSQNRQTATLASSYAKLCGSLNQAAPSSSSVCQITQMRENCFAATSPSNSACKPNTMKMKHSAAPLNSHDTSSSDSTTSRMVSAVTSNKESAITTESMPYGEHFDRANKSLKSIRASPGMDEDKYAAFKIISAEYHQNLINTWEYLSYVEQFSLSHLVFELAQLCPDSQKEKELINAYNTSLFTNSKHENRSNSVSSKKSVKEGREVVDHAEKFTAKDTFSDSMLDNVTKLQSIGHPSVDEVELQTKDAFRTQKDKIPSAIKVSRNPSSKNANGGDSCSKKEIFTNNGSGAEGFKKNKKTSKFLRTRLGDGSAALSLDLRQTSPEKNKEENSSRPAVVMPGRGAWVKGGGQKLFSQRGA